MKMMSLSLPLVEIHGIGPTSAVTQTNPGHNKNLLAKETCSKKLRFPRLGLYFLSHHKTRLSEQTKLGSEVHPHSQGSSYGDCLCSLQYTGSPAAFQRKTGTEPIGGVNRVSNVFSKSTYTVLLRSRHQRWL